MANLLPAPPAPRCPALQWANLPSPAGLHDRCRRPRSWRSRVPAAVHAPDQTPETKTAEQATALNIEGLSREYCDEFSCSSSPAVENTMRILSRDIQRRGVTRSLYAQTVQYRDPFRSFQGADGYKRFTWVSDSVGDARAVVTRMRIEGNAIGVINWRLRGKIGPVPIDADFESRYTLNVLTGRVEEHRDTWGLGRCGLPGKAAFTASRLAWALRQKSLDAREGSGKLLDKLTGSVDEGDGGQIYGDPTDPTKFFQQQDSSFQDAVALCTLVAVLYLVFQAFTELEKIS